MTAYELGRLNDKEFETLATQLVGVVNNVRLERFKPGKDQGVDGRFFGANSGEVIVQAKHWEKTGVGPLLSYLEKKEAAKVAKLKPSRYLLVTSVPLSRADKRRIKDIFSPFILSPTDIFGNEDIQDFFRDHPDIVRQHYKLWLASSEVLTLMINAPIIGRSTFKLEESVGFAPKYVPTKCHDEALHRLNTLGSIIIIGEPGIGKSTLAEQLVLNCAAENYELCVIQDDLSEAEGVWKDKKKQAFFFDDFLGRNYLEAIGRNHDSHVLAFMRRVQKDKNKRFILTSRTTILQQGKSLSELFRAQNIDQKEYEVRITDLTAFDKARILYNHIWFGDLGPEFVEQLYVDKHYREIVSHRNFNPRLISFITDNHKIAGVTAEGYWDYIKATLENPRDVWRGVFENQLDKMGRLIVTLVVLNGGTISERSLREVVGRARGSDASAQPPAEWSLAFERSFQMCVGAVVTRNLDRTRGEVTIELFNPSVGDFVLRQYATDANTLENILALLSDERAVGQFRSLVHNGIVSHFTQKIVVQRLVQTAWKEPTTSPRFVSALAELTTSDPNLAQELAPELKLLAGRIFDVMAASSAVWMLCPFAEYCLREGLVPADATEWEQFVIQAMDGVGDDETLIAIAEVAVLLDDPLQTKVARTLAEHVVDSWKDKIDQELDDNGVAIDQTNTDDETEFEEAEAEIRKFIRGVLGDYPISFDPKDIDEIVAKVDIWDRISENGNSGDGDESNWRGSGGGGGGNVDLEKIDDLFDRER